METTARDGRDILVHGCCRLLWLLTELLLALIFCLMNKLFAWCVWEVLIIATGHQGKAIIFILMADVCRNTQKTTAFLLGWEDKNRSAVTVKCWRGKSTQKTGGMVSAGTMCWSVEAEVSSWGQRVEMAMVPFCWHEVGGTGPDSLTVKLTDLFPEGKTKSKRTPRLCASRFLIFMARTCCEEEARRNKFASTRGRGSPSARRFNHQVLHIFNEHISCKKLLWLLLCTAPSQIEIRTHSRVSQSLCFLMLFLWSHRATTRFHRSIRR